MSGVTECSETLRFYRSEGSRTACRPTLGWARQDKSGHGLNVIEKPSFRSVRPDAF